MIDHLLGRPSLRSRKLQILLTLLLWTVYLFRGHRHGPPIIRRLSHFFTHKLTAYQLITLTLLYLYTARNFAKLAGLESPEPMASLGYTRGFFRATWVLTALDAGFWTAMKIRNKKLRDAASIVFSVYYLIAAERADEKVRRVRATLTADHLRVSWNKQTASPYLSTLSKLLHPFPRPNPRRILIPRPPTSIHKNPIPAYLFCTRPRTPATSLILDFPGGGFVAMEPMVHMDRLSSWASQTGLPVISIDYRKAPEFPYPAGLHDCYDAYTSLILSRGRCLSPHLTFSSSPKICLTGDSAGGNLAAGVTLMALDNRNTSETGHLKKSERHIPAPAGLVLSYPSLDLSMSSWLTDDEMALIRSRPILRQKSMQYSRTLSRRRLATAPEPPATHLAMSSRLASLNDRLLTPEMMRAMIMLYIGPSHRPDFASDFLLSPIVAPEALLARFPKVYFLTGERDPLVDDTVIMAGRIRAAKEAVRRQRKELGLDGEGGGKGGPREGKAGPELYGEGMVEVSLIQGVSHGFMVFPSVWPGAVREIKKAAGWCVEILSHDVPEEEETEEDESGEEEEEGDDVEPPLEIGGGVEGYEGIKPGKKKRTKRKKPQRMGSAVSLASHEDIVDRRMKGLVMTLKGEDSEEGGADTGGEAGEVKVV